VNTDNTDAVATPLVSIIMPAYNAAAYLQAAVESVLKQTYPQWELIVINDASTDGTSALAMGLAAQDQRIRVFQQAENTGVASARNRGLDNAAGKYIAFLDSDDLWEPEKLATQIQLMEDKNLLICYSSYHRIDGKGRLKGIVSVPPQVSYKDMLKSNFIGNLTGIYNAEVLGKQYFSELRHEDYIAWLELMKKAGLAHAAAGNLASYRVSSGSLSANKLRTVKWQWRIYRRSQALNRFKSAWYMGFYVLNALRKRS